jgi:hypothetical protein
MSLSQLISAYQRSVVPNRERELLEKELVKRKIDLDEAKKMKVEPFQDIEEQKTLDRAVMKGRGHVIFRRIFWRVVVPLIAILVIGYGLQFWSWLTK